MSFCSKTKFAMDTKNISLRESVYNYAAQKFSAYPEYLWRRFPRYAVLRRSSNRKWFAIIMDIPKCRLGFSDSAEHMDIMNVKVRKELLGFHLSQKGILPGYHSSRGNWISVVLDGTVDFKQICDLLDASYDNVGSRSKSSARTYVKEWIVPANLRYYDLTTAFDKSDEIIWKQGRGIIAGDYVYLYAGAPVSAILYRCQVVETDIPYSFKKENLSINQVMKLKLLKKYKPDDFTFSLIRSEYGVGAVRGARGVPHRLSAALNSENDSLQQ